MNKKILIIQKDELQAKTLSFLLAGSGFRTTSYTDGTKALEAVNSERFDLVISDETPSETSQELDFITKIKSIQPHLPVVLVTEEKNLDNVILSIRSGVTDIIDGPHSIKRAIQHTRNFFDTDNEVTSADIFEVEQMLESLRGESLSEDSSVEKSRELANVQAELGRLQEINKDLNSELSNIQNELERAKELQLELSSNPDSANSTSPELLKKLDRLESKETELEERESRMAKQRADLEVQLGELEVQRYELEEKISKAGLGGIDNSELENEIEMLKKESDTMLLKSNERRLEQDARIKDLERALNKAETASVDTSTFESEINSLKVALRDIEQKNAEAEFVIEQKEKQIESLKSDQSSTSSPIHEDFEEEKRLFEIEKFKLQEKLDRFILEKGDFENDHEKRMRELQVERRDAEISIREMQAQLKEEQLNCHVEKASLDDAKRQFGQAQENFQEDVQNLQRQQTELRDYEKKLQQLQAQIEENGANASASALPESPSVLNEEIQAAPTKSEDKNNPTSWNKPKVEKQGRGPLRIGRRSAF